ncbi:hypothetical protein AX16_006281 [Volvariella volvacea WC 439]|nr:hypothetical protein AX16_006281 [Volvariella volvacea WC 439]
MATKIVKRLIDQISRIDSDAEVQSDVGIRSTNVNVTFDLDEEEEEVPFYYSSSDDDSEDGSKEAEKAMKRRQQLSKAAKSASLSADVKPVVLAQQRVQGHEDRLPQWLKTAELVVWKESSADDITFLYRRFINSGSLKAIKKTYNEKKMTKQDKEDYQLFGHQAIRIFAAACYPLQQVSLPPRF